MAENIKEEKKSSKAVIILLIILILLLLVIGVVVVFFLKKDNAPMPEEGNGGIIQYEAGVVNLEDAQKVMDELAESAKNGNMIVSYKNYAFSNDGTHFECTINNNIGNNYDMYINIYKDSSFEEQILLTGLVLTQVEDDHSTLHAQSMVVLRLVVEE